MAKAHLTLPNGTQVSIEGTPEEVHRLLNLTRGTGSEAKVRAGAMKKRKSAGAKSDAAEATQPDLAQIVNLAKDCNEAKAIEKNILDRISIVDRVLLPLYILKKHGRSPHGLTSGEVSKITKELGVPVSQPNASTALSGAASKYVMGDKVRRRGQPVRYRLSRRGERYLAAVIGGKGGEE